MNSKSNIYLFPRCLSAGVAGVLLVIQKGKANYTATRTTELSVNQKAETEGSLFAITSTQTETRNRTERTKCYGSPVAFRIDADAWFFANEWNDCVGFYDSQRVKSEPHAHSYTRHSEW